MITISNSRFDGEADDTTTRRRDETLLFRMLRAVESNKTKTKEWRSDAVEGDKRRRKSHIFQPINKQRDHRAIGHIKIYSDRLCFFLSPGQHNVIIVCASRLVFVIFPHAFFQRSHTKRTNTHTPRRPHENEE